MRTALLLILTSFAVACGEGASASSTETDPTVAAGWEVVATSEVGYCLYDHACIAYSDGEDSELAQERCELGGLILPPGEFSTTGPCGYPEVFAHCTDQNGDPRAVFAPPDADATEDACEAVEVVCIVSGWEPELPSDCPV